MLKNQFLMMAAEGYYSVLAVLAEMLRQYAATLGLMVPGVPDQLALLNGNGVDLTADGVPVYRAVVKRRGSVFRSPLEFGRAVQDALDATCYANCVERLVLLQVEQLPGGYVGLTLTVRSW